MVGEVAGLLSGPLLDVFSTPWWECVGLAVFCLSFAFLAGGLTMGLTTLEPEKVRSLLSVDEAYARTDEERLKLREQKAHGGRVLPLIMDHHRLLVTLLLTNALASQTLPILLSCLVPAWLAVLCSTGLVLVFGEVIPSIVFTGPSQLAIVATLSPIVVSLRCLFCAIVLPMAALLDLLLGPDHRGPYGRGSGAELAAMLASSQLEGCIEADTQKMLVGAVDTERKHVGDEDILTPMCRVFMLPMSARMDKETLAQILYRGYSRVLVYQEDMHNIRGMLIVKRLITVNPADARRISTMCLRQMVVFHMDTTLRDALNVFQQGKSHMGLVVSNREKVLEAWRLNKPIPPDVHMAGIVTLETILEKILQEGIEDEDDRRKAQLLAGAIRSVRRRGSTYELADPETLQHLLRVYFERWKEGWKLSRAVPTDWFSTQNKTRSSPDLTREALGEDSPSRRRAARKAAQKARASGIVPASAVASSPPRLGGEASADAAQAASALRTPLLRMGRRMSDVV